MAKLGHCWSQRHFPDRQARTCHDETCLAAQCLWDICPPKFEPPDPLSRGSTSCRCRPNSGRFRAQLDQIRPTIWQLNRCCPKIGRNQDKIGRILPGVGSDVAGSPKVGQVWPEIGRVRPQSAWCQPPSAGDTWTISSGCSPIWAKFGLHAVSLDGPRSGAALHRDSSPTQRAQHKSNPCSPAALTPAMRPDRPTDRPPDRETDHPTAGPLSFRTRLA